MEETILEPVPPVYNVARQLRFQLNRSTQKAPVNDKRSIIAETEGMITELMKICIKANRCSANPMQRAEFLRAASDIVLDIELNVRIMLDLDIIKKKGFAQMVRIEDNVRGQLFGWLRATTE